MANIEKHIKGTIEQIDLADFSEIPTHRRSSRLIGQYIKNRQDGTRNHIVSIQDRPRPVLVRLESTPATPPNLERIRARVQSLNRRLAASDTPIRLRVI